MADVKISALPLASTPLAGTEVLPIVQSATTDQVSVANLTAGRAVSAASLTLTTTPLAVGSGGTGLSSLTAGYIPYGNGTSAFGSSSNLFWDSANSRLGIGTSSPAFATEIVCGYNNGLHLKDSTGTVYGGYFVESGTMAFVTRSNHGLRFGTNDTTRMTLDASGNLGINYTNMATLGARLYCYGYSGFGQSSNGSPSLGSRSFWASTWENTSGGYGLGVNVNSASGIVLIQSQRFDGTATAYDMSLQPLGGNLLVGTTTNNSRAPRLALNGDSVTWSVGPSASNSVFVVYNASDVGVYMASGSTAWTGTSDERIKNITGNITDALAKTNTLRAVNFSWKADVKNTPHVGLIAQDVQRVLPEAVSENDGYLGVAYTDVIPLLTAAIQELAAKVAELEAKI